MEREREGRCLISLLGSGHIASDLFLFTQLDRIKEDKVKKERGLKVSLSASFPLFRSAIYTLERNSSRLKIQREFFILKILVRVPFVGSDSCCAPTLYL